MESPPSRYLPLDGLRGLAIAAVFCFHYRVEAHSPGEWGWVGVDLFFALSGYLITGILYDSLHKPRYFRNFYIRRALRIFPLYWALWALIGIVVLIVPQGRPDPWYLLWPAYLGNYLDLHAIRAGLPHGHYDIPAIIHALGENFYIRVGPYWSLAIEEQYYLLWPLVLWLVRDRTRLLRTCLAGMLLILALRVALHLLMPPAWIEDNEVYFFAFTRADTLLAGAVVALWTRGPRGLLALPTRWIVSAGAWSVVALAASSWNWGLFQGSSFAGWMQTYGFTLIAVSAAAILVSALRIPWFARLLAFKPLVSLGQVSYGFYIFHVLFWDCDRIPLDATSSPALRVLIHCATFAFVWTLSWLSFRYFEMPFLRMKDRWAPSSGERVLAVHLPPIEELPRPAGFEEEVA